jgi:hypothetical protein
VDNLKHSLTVVLAGAALGVLIGGMALAASAPGAAPPAPASPFKAPTYYLGESFSTVSVAATALPAAAPAPKTAAVPAESAKPPSPLLPGETGLSVPAKPPAEIQVSGRLMHAWDERPDLQVILAIDGFTVLTRREQLTARDGVIWYDKAAAAKTGKVTLGVYAETGVEYKRAGGQVEKYDSVYLVMEAAGELALVHEDKELRGKADNTELFLRAKKLRQEYLAGGSEKPLTVVPPPPPPTQEPIPGVREAAVPQEILVVPQDDVRKVNLSSVPDGDRQVITYTGGVYVFYRDMEIATDSIIIWAPKDAAGALTGGVGPETTAGKTATPAPEPRGILVDPPPTKPTDAAKPAPKGTPRLAIEAYMEGNVRINQKSRSLTCSQLFYDFEHDQALAINTQIHTFVAGKRNVPAYIYAKEVRQLARDILVATDAKMTTCSFNEPHYDVYSKRLTIQELTPTPETEGENVQYHRIRFLGEDMEAEIRSVPLTWWPRMSGDFTEASTALRNIRIAHRSNFGVGVATQWHLLKLLGLERDPNTFDPYLNLDFWSKRGPGIGVEGMYQKPDYYGQILTYLMPHDSGTDSFGGVDIDPEHTVRGRATWRHRQFLPNDWELTLEGSFISDPTFMNEFFREEDRTGKAQETLAYLKKVWQDQALWIMASARVEDFYTRTEYYPQAGYTMLGHSFWDDKLTYYQDTEASIARYLPHSATKPFDPSSSSLVLNPANSDLKSPTTFIFDTIHEVDMPLKAGVVNVVPFVEGRLSYFSSSPDGGPEGRAEAKEGVRLSTQAWKVYPDVESRLWDLHKIRHVNIFDVTAYASQVSLHSSELYPFAPTEAGSQPVIGVDGQGVVALGWHQRLETKRGVPDPEGKQQKVDWLTTDLVGTFFSNSHHAAPGDPAIGPDTGPEFNNLDFLVQWRATDQATLWSETLYDLDRSKLAKFAIGALITHTPRISYSFGQRILPDADSSVTYGGFDYQINDKWRLSVLEQYDWKRKQNVQSDIFFTRRMDCWLMRIRFRHQTGGGGSYVGLEFQPLGLKEVKLGW